MNWDFLALSELFFKGKGSICFFLLGVILVFLLVLLNFVFCLCKNEYTFAKRVWLIVLVGGINVVFLSVCLAFSFQTSLFLLFFGVSIIFISTTFFISPKKRVQKEQLSCLAKLLDKKAQVENTLKENNLVLEKLQGDEIPNYIKEEEKTQDKYCDLDFEHVKNVIARLEYYPLSQTDKRQVNELEGYIRSAENGGMNEYYKSKINDGLGALLKLMSKYGF